MKDNDLWVFMAWKTPQVVSGHGHGRDGYGRDGHGRDSYGRDGRERKGYGRGGHERDGYRRLVCSTSKVIQEGIVVEMKIEESGIVGMDEAEMVRILQDPTKTNTRLLAAVDDGKSGREFMQCCDQRTRRSKMLLAVL